VFHWSPSEIDRLTLDDLRWWAELASATIPKKQK
jgi:GpE protein